jgi:hypothetical protein
MLDLMKRLFPDRNIGNRGYMCSPLRDDRRPSWSCFQGRGGVWRAKDHGTDETYDNIKLYRTLFPELTYVQAIDGLSWLLFGRSALVNYSEGEMPTKTSLPPRSMVPHLPLPEREGVLKVVEVLGLSDAGVPSSLVSYWRGRGISDNNIFFTCVYAKVENSNRKGNILLDESSGLPILDSSHKEVLDDGIMEGIGLYNDIGGLVLREPDTSLRKGFKGSTSSFVSVILADGSRPAEVVRFEGMGDCRIGYVLVNLRAGCIHVNATQRFTGIRPEACQFAEPFLRGWVGREVDERDVKCLCAVLTALNAPTCGRAVVVEGMFEALSFQELQASRGRGYCPGVDLVVLNSIANLNWAVPFLCKEDVVRTILNNDLRSGAGQRATVELDNKIMDFRTACGSRTKVVSDTSLLGKYNDLNDALRASKGLLNAQVEAVATKIVKPVQRRKGMVM